MLQPANRLPPEIIPRITQHILRDSDDTYLIIPLTHVCRYWRQAIISAPENWTLISTLRTKLTALTLERSKAAGLQLRLDPYAAGFHNFCDLIAPYIQNVETLQFGVFDALKQLTQALPNFPKSTPNLRMLELTVMRRLDASIDPFESFPNTLVSLSLDDIPLYPSFLKLRTLRKLSLKYRNMHCPALDTLLDFLEENLSLESVDLTIETDQQFLAHSSHRQATIANQLQHLSIDANDAMIARTLISHIPLRRGAHLEIISYGDGTDDEELGLDDVLSGISMTHLSNLSSPTFMECRSPDPAIRLVGPNGSFLFVRHWFPGIYLGIYPAETSVLPLTNIRELRLAHSDPSNMFLPSSIPALETLTIECDTNISDLFSALLPNPSFSPSLKTLGFLHCAITEEFMEELAQFASDRKNTTSAWLHRVVIIHLDGRVPTAASIHGLEEHVPIVDVRFGRTFPTDLT